MASTHQPLSTEDIDSRFDPSSVPFETTDEIEAKHRIVGQDRAVDAIKLALQIDRPGYNLYTAGPRGIGKRTLVGEMLTEAAADTPPQRDWFYTYNFRESHKPDAMSVPSGRGAEFQRAMNQLVFDLQSSLAAAFQGEDYRNSVQSLQEEVEESQSSKFDHIREEAEGRGLALIQTPMGWAFAPMEEGRVMQPEKFNQLPEEERRRIEGEIREMQEMLRAAMQDMPKVMKGMRDKVRELNQETAQFAVHHLIESLKSQYSDIEEIVGYLEHVEADVIANTEEFLIASQKQQSVRPNASTPGEGSGVRAQPSADTGGPDQDFFRRYKVNLIIDNSERDHAPVVYEDEPTFERLMGRIEHRAEMGALLTDFNLIRGGALHRANGGYLMLNARKLLTQPQAWDALKRALEAEEIRIEPMWGAMGLPRTTTLEPEPIPLAVKVGLMGESWIYYLLNAYDPDFSSLFKVLADFDERLERTDDYISELSHMIAAMVADDKLRPFDRTGVARLLDYLSRLAGDRERLSTSLEDLQDTMREASHLVAVRNGGETRSPVTAEDVEAALDARQNRASRISERIQEQMLRETLLIDTDGAEVGQINGLSVYMLGGHSFGKPSRITARVRIGRGNVVDIEREVELGGPLHSKGVMILSGYLGANYAHDVPLSLSASLVFEQSYGGVDGDSASSAELYALLSALSEVPIKQSFAVTGSVNQLGEVQAIGGVNEKIEGFFDLCAARGLTGEQGVLIPRSNVKHLTLHRRVRDAVEDGKFSIYPVETINQGIEILTGADAATINEKVDQRLRGFARQLKEFARSREEKAD